MFAQAGTSATQLAQSLLRVGGAPSTPTPSRPRTPRAAAKNRPASAPAKRRGQSSKQEWNDSVVVPERPRVPFGVLDRPVDPPGATPTKSK
jgi:hypothetical protein